MNTVWTTVVYLLPQAATERSTVHPHSSPGADRASIKPCTDSTDALTHPLLRNLPSILFSPNSPNHPLIYYLTPLLTLFFIFHSPMVATRPKNKLSHPAAPVMTRTAKEKAGIKVKPRKKRVTKDETIRQLQARIAAMENPDEESPSREPLVSTTQLSSTQIRC